MEIYQIMLWGEPHRIKADFSLANSNILLDCEGTWEYTGYQVADFRHRGEDALYEICKKIHSPSMDLSEFNNEWDKNEITTRE